MKIWRMQHLRWEVLALVVVLASALAVLSGGKVHAQPADYWLTIFHNNDGESDLLPDGDAGSHSVVWTGRDEAGNPVPSGTYFYRMDTGSTSRNRTMVLLK